MSILFEHENFAFICHQHYIQSIYSDIAHPFYQNLQINNDLFEINVAFKEVNPKIRAVNQKFNELKEDIEYVKSKYTELLQHLHKFLEEKPLERNNTKALKTSRDLFEESKRTQVVNVVGKNEEQITVLVNLRGVDFLFPANCKFYAKDVKKITESISEVFDAILLDPPWWNKAVRRKRKKTDDGYSMMYNEDIAALPLERLLKDDSLVVIWCTNSPDQVRCIVDEIFPRWGVTYIAKWFWLKITMSGDPIVNFSIPGEKQPFEKVLIGVKGDRFRDAVRASDRKLLVSVPSALHSHKPPLTNILDSLLGGSKDRLEIFARYLLPGWSSYGLDVLQFQNVCMYKSNS